MTEILKGKLVQDKISQNSIRKMDTLRAKNIRPRIGIIRIGDRPGDISYEKSIGKYCQTIGVEVRYMGLDKGISEEDLLDQVGLLNEDDGIGGVLMLRPFPKHINEDRVRNFLKPDKDIDCMNTLSLGRVFEGDVDGFMPCTARAVIETLEGYKIPLEGKNVAIINRTIVVGKPLAIMLLNKNATVTICHSKTENLKEIIRKSDIVISALGRAKFLTRDYFKEGSILIDVGMSLDEDGKLSGDMDYENLLGYVDKISPVPGGVGRITTSILIDQLLNSYLK